MKNRNWKTIVTLSMCMTLAAVGARADVNLDRLMTMWADTAIQAELLSRCCPGRTVDEIGTVNIDYKGGQITFSNENGSPATLTPSVTGLPASGDSKPVAGLAISFCNGGKGEGHMNADIERSVTNIQKVTLESSIEVGEKVSIEEEVPEVIKGSVTMSVNVGLSFAQTQTTENGMSATGGIEKDVPENTYGEVSCTAYQLSVPSTTITYTLTVPDGLMINVPAISSYSFLDNRGNSIGGGPALPAFSFKMSKYLDESDRQVSITGTFSGSQWGLKMDCSAQTTPYSELNGTCTQKQTDPDITYTPKSGDTTNVASK